MQDELLDLVNEKDEIIGSVWRSEAHKNPKLTHREVGIVIFNDQNQVLLQQRSLNKSHNPGRWSLSASGHIQQGQEPINSVNRELYEELGLQVEPIYYKKIFNIYENRESRFMYLYYAIVKDQPQVTLDLNEVMDYAWVKIDELGIFATGHEYPLQELSNTTIVEIAKYLKLL